MCLSGVSLICLPIYKVKRQKPQKGAGIGILKPNCQSNKLAFYRNHCGDSSQIMHNGKDPAIIRGLSKHAYNKYNVADGRHFKNRKIDITSITV